MGDPAGACAHVREHLAPDGALMIIEPYANDDIADKLTPVGAAYYGFSTLLCTPSSLSQDVGTALGAQAGEPAYAASSPAPASAHCAVSPKPRSTSSSKPSRERGMRRRQPPSTPYPR